MKEDMERLEKLEMELVKERFQKDLLALVDSCMNEVK
jgi:hypothetical protein